MKPLPKWLGPEGRKKWNELKKRLPTLSEDQFDILALLCRAWEQYIGAQEDLTTHGRVQENGRPHASVAIGNEASKQILKLSKMLGLTETSKTGRSAEPSKLEALLEG